MNLKIHATRMLEMPDVSSRRQIAWYTRTVGDPALDRWRSLGGHQPVKTRSMPALGVRHRKSGESGCPANVPMVTRSTAVSASIEMMACEGFATAQTGALFLVCKGYPIVINTHWFFARSLKSHVRD